MVIISEGDREIWGPRRNFPLAIAVWHLIAEPELSFAGRIDRRRDDFEPLRGISERGLQSSVRPESHPGELSENPVGNTDLTATSESGYILRHQAFIARFQSTFLVTFGNTSLLTSRVDAGHSRN